MPWQWPRFVAVPAVRVIMWCLRKFACVTCADTSHERVSRGAWAPQFEVPAALRGFAIYVLVVFLGPKIAS